MQDSPCIAVCTTLYDRICRGCRRTDYEVSEWVTYSQERKYSIMDRLKHQQEFASHAQVSEELIAELHNLYSQPNRHYHNWDHIVDGFYKLMYNKASVEQFQAWLFHDAVYEAGRSDNELNSAELASSKGMSNFVVSIILDTVNHIPHTHDARLVIDVDLSGLALPYEQFNANSQKIKAEFAHIPDLEFNRGRQLFAKKFLARPFIFYCLKDLEQPARKNLETLID